jgi:hypothetical protein
VLKLFKKNLNLPSTGALACTRYAIASGGHNGSSEAPNAGRGLTSYAGKPTLLLGRLLRYVSLGQWLRLCLWCGFRQRLLCGRPRLRYHSFGLCNWSFLWEWFRLRFNGGLLHRRWARLRSCLWYLFGRHSFGSVVWESVHCMLVFQEVGNGEDSGAMMSGSRTGG